MKGDGDVGNPEILASEGRGLQNSVYPKVGVGLAKEDGQSE